MQKKILLFVFGLFMFVFVTGCTLHFKGTDVELDSEPTEPTMSFSQHCDDAYSLDSLEVF